MRRKWTPEEKLRILREIENSGAVVKICRKWSIDPSMYYKWKAKYEAEGINGLKRANSLNPELKKLLKENERLKRIVADKELEVSILRDLLKKTFSNKG